MIVPSHRMPLLSLHQIADGPTYYPLLLNGEDHPIIRLRPQYRCWLIAVMRSGHMLAVESGSRQTCREALYRRVPPGNIAYLIHVRPK